VQIENGSDRIIGLCCVKDSEAWFENVLKSHLKVCDEILVLDDNSTDRTGDIAQSFERVHYWRQVGLTRNEARDHTWLFSKVHSFRPQWCWWFDGDETLWKGTREDILDTPKGTSVVATWLLDLWGDGQHYAADWSHSKRSIFRYIQGVEHWPDFVGQGPCHLHCNRLPHLVWYYNAAHVAQVPIIELHWSWLNPDMCKEKLAWYKEHDPDFSTFKPYRRFEQAPKDVQLLVDYTEGSVTP